MLQVIKNIPPRFPSYKLYLAEMLGSAAQFTQPTIIRVVDDFPHQADVTSSELSPT